MNKTLQKFGTFPSVEKLAAIPRRSIPSFIRTENILSPFELYEFLNQNHGFLIKPMLMVWFMYNF